MANNKPTWLLKVIERGYYGDAGDVDAPDEYQLKDFRGELMFKGKVHWILDADTEEELEALAREKMVIAKKINGEEQDLGYVIDLGE